MGARTYPEAYFAENMVAIPPHNFCTRISIRKPYGIYKQNFKRKVVGGMAGVFCNWLTFGCVPKGRDEWEDERRRPEKMMCLTKRAPRATWAHVVVGGALCSWPITSAEAPHPLPPLTPPTRLSNRIPVKIF